MRNTVSSREGLKESPTAPAQAKGGMERRRIRLWN
jgi:hypothetical protein